MRTFGRPTPRCATVILPVWFGTVWVVTMWLCIPVGLRALTHGKMPPLVHKNIEKVANVRKLVRKLEESENP